MRELARRRSHERLMRVGELARSANSFGLFRTGNRLEGIQRQLAHFPALREERKAHKAQAIIRNAERAEAVLEDEHEDVALANRRQMRGRRGLIVSCALFAAMAADLAVLLTKPFFTPDFVEKYQPTSIAAAALLALAAFPVRDFVFVFRYDALKENVLSGLEGVKDRMREERDRAGKR
jgi:hypothetical protein